MWLDKYKTHQPGNLSTIVVAVDLLDCNVSRWYFKDIWPDAKEVLSNLDEFKSSSGELLVNHIFHNNIIFLKNYAHTCISKYQLSLWTTTVRWLDTWCESCYASLNFKFEFSCLKRTTRIWRNHPFSSSDLKKTRRTFILQDIHNLIIQQFPLNGISLLSWILKKKLLSFAY